MKIDKISDFSVMDDSIGGSWHSPSAPDPYPEWPGTSQKAVFFLVFWGLLQNFLFFMTCLEYTWFLLCDLYHFWILGRFMIGFSLVL